MLTKKDKQKRAIKVANRKRTLAKNGNTSGNGKIDIKMAAKARFEDGMTYAEIAKIYDVSESAIQQSLDKMGKYYGAEKLVETVQAFEEYKNIFTKAALMTLTNAINKPEILEKATLNQIAYAAKIFYDMDKINNNEATSIVKYEHHIMEAKELGDKIKQLEEELQGKDVIALDDDDWEEIN